MQVQVTSSGTSKVISDYNSCSFSEDGDFDIYVKPTKTYDDTQTKGKIRKVAICFTERLNSKTDGISKTNYGIGRYSQVAGGNSSQVYFNTQHVTPGLPREWYMERSLKLGYGKLHVEGGKATNLRVCWEEVFDRTFKNSDYKTIVLLKMDSWQVYHLEGLEIDYFDSDEEYTNGYLAAAKKLNAGLFQEKPTKTSSSEPSKPWKEILGFRQRKKQAPVETQKPTFKEKLSKFFGGSLFLQ